MNNKPIDFDINKKISGYLTAKSSDGTGSRSIIFRLIQNFKPYNLEGFSIKVAGKKPDGNDILIDTVIIDVKRGLVKFDFTEQMLVLPGILDLELVFYKNGIEMSSHSFQVEVLESARDAKSIVSSTEYGALVNGLVKLDNWDKIFTETSGKIEEKYTERLNQVDSQLAQINSHRQTIAITLAEIEGVNDLDRLQKAHDKILTFGGGTIILPYDELTITDTFFWNISRVSIKGNATTIKCVLNDKNKYAIKLTSEDLLEYKPTQNNKLIVSSGFQLDGVDRNCKGIDFSSEGEQVNTISNITLKNVLIRRFDIGLDFGNNTYMIDFNNCVISYNRINIQQRTPKNNAGERISFVGCDITGTQGIENSVCINNLDFTTFEFLNCSIDWHRRLFFNKGLLIFTDCHIESPPYALDNPETTGNYFGECGRLGHVYFKGGRTLLNTDSSNTIKALFNLTDYNSSVSYTDHLLQVYSIDFLAVGKGLVNNNNLRFPRNGLDFQNFHILNNYRKNCFIDADFSFSSISFLDDFFVNEGQLKNNPNINGVKCVQVLNNTEINKDITLGVNIPISRLENFYKFSCEFNLNNKKPLEYSIEFKAINNRRVYRLTSNNFNTSNNDWKTFSSNFQFCGTPINTSIITQATITIKCNLDVNESFYFSKPLLTCF